MVALSCAYTNGLDEIFENTRRFGKGSRPRGDVPISFGKSPFTRDFSHPAIICIYAAYSMVLRHVCPRDRPVLCL